MSVATSWLSSGPSTALLGSTTPRIWTPPLVLGEPGPCGCGCALTPETSYGFDVMEFAESLGVVRLQDGQAFPATLDPWERWLVIHGGELLPEGAPRFRKVVVVVARQNGKTHTLIVLSLWWQFVRRYPIILGTSTKLEYAKESWSKAAEVAKAAPVLAEFLPKDRSRGIKTVNGGVQLKTTDGARYMIAPANGDGGRSLTIDRLVLDELRQHKDYSAWDAAVPAQNALLDAQAWAISNMGGADAVVLNDLIDEGTTFIETGEGDPQLGVFLWTNEDDADPTDPESLATSNPNLGRRLPLSVLLEDGRAAVRKGGEKLAGFKTEVLCVRVKTLDPAVDPQAWAACELDAPAGPEAAFARVALCLDVSPDGLHATLAAARRDTEGRTRVWVVAYWEGPGCMDAMRRELASLEAQVKPAARGWFPNGPAAAMAPDLKGRYSEIGTDATAVCMGFDEQVTAGQVLHPADRLLDAHVTGAEKLKTGDRWRFSRKGGGHCDAAYAAAGAVHLARTLPAPIGRPRVLTARRRSTPLSDSR